MAISRTREYAADLGAAQITGNPQALAHALEKLEQIGKQKQEAATPVTA
jgi:heat shock protein HtpX